MKGGFPHALQKVSTSKPGLDAVKLALEVYLEMDKRPEKVSRGILVLSD